MRFWFGVLMLCASGAFAADTSEPGCAVKDNVVTCDIARLATIADFLSRTSSWHFVLLKGTEEETWYSTMIFDADNPVLVERYFVCVVGLELASRSEATRTTILRAPTDVPRRGCGKLHGGGA